ncbi:MULTISPECIES: hypothetical protein [unclassified Acinetobacter]|uniref:hypothetical protein n=1 Tax=unclassified Acinetobacter TaxID=196816 RepID=UPI0029343D20|nr:MULTISPECIES: hypothetical protein [unclassified Acinetobacter]WOE32025.1 hypothetical protein QSG84_02015 [Acinetobacter sp. SAAs470]WOE37493.1 hypothetical protein QSG86_11060 [Acinetobacter sp. SAAs474]
MKKIVLSVMIGSIAMMTHAKSNSIDKKIHQENCQTISRFAEIAMEVRQNGMPLDEALSIVNETPDLVEMQIAKTIVLDAYDQKKVAKQKINYEMKRFANKYKQGCLKMYT